MEKFEEIKALIEAVEEDVDKFYVKGNKAAATRARKAVGELKKLVTDYRKASVTESKRTV